MAGGGILYCGGELLCAHQRLFSCGICVEAGEGGLSGFTGSFLFSADFGVPSSDRRGFCGGS